MVFLYNDYIKSYFTWNNVGVKDQYLRNTASFHDFYDYTIFQFPAYLKVWGPKKCIGGDFNHVMTPVDSNFWNVSIFIN